MNRLGPVLCCSAAHNGVGEGQWVGVSRVKIIDKRSVKVGERCVFSSSASQ